MKRIFSILLAILMIIGMVPAVMAETPEQIIIYVTDSGSDGWNGAVLYFYTGSTVSRMTLNYGDGGYATVPYNPYNDYYFRWGKGYYDEEITLTFVLGETSTTFNGDELEEGKDYMVAPSICSHTVENGVCTACELTCGTDFNHYIVNALCKYCGAPCPHNYDTAGYCRSCGDICAHPSSTDGFCDNCGNVDPNAEEILVDTEDELVLALDYGVSFKLTADVSLTQPIDLWNNQEIDLNGHTLTLARKGSSYGSLTFRYYSYAEPDDAKITIKNGTVTALNDNEMSVFHAEASMENVQLDLTVNNFGGTITLDEDTTVKKLDLTYGTTYCAAAEVEELVIGGTTYLDVDPTAVLQRGFTAEYDEDTGLWAVTKGDYTPELTGETFTVYFNNWYPAYGMYFLNLYDEEMNSDPTQSAREIGLEFNNIYDENGDYFIIPMETEDGGKTWKAEIDTAYANCWFTFSDLYTGFHINPRIMPVEDDMLFDVTAGTWIPYQEFLGDRLTGDLNGDGSLTAADATLLLQYLVGKVTEIDTDLADMSGDGKLTIYDAVLLMGALSA